MLDDFKHWVENLIVDFSRKISSEDKYTFVNYWINSELPINLTLTRAPHIS